MQSTLDIASLVAPASAVNDDLRAFLEGRDMPDHLCAAIEYALLGGGKRLRPALVLRCCEAVGGAFADAMPPAGAIELVHTFSLVHDDLPAMDDDDLRRGRPTLHKHTSEAMAILAGDMMLGLAVELIVTRSDSPALAAELVSELVAATNDMIAGQVYDTLPDPHEEGVEPLEQLRRTHRHKTAALLRAACRMGAICGGATDEQLDAVTAYGEAIGLMFQAVDDLLDVTQSTEQLGKTAGKDEQQDKLTYPSLLGLDATRAEVRRLHDEALAALQPLGDHAAALRQLADYMAVREK